MSKLKVAARRSALELISLGAAQKKWTPYEREQWTKAFNALQRLAGRKIVWKRGRMAVETRRAA